MRALLQNSIRLSLIGTMALSLCRCGSGGDPAPTPKPDSSVDSPQGSTSGSPSGSTAGETSGSGSASGSSPASDSASGAQSDGNTGTQPDPNKWTLGMTAADWDVISNGEGSVTFDADGILMKPMAATVPGETHGAWLLAKSTESQLLQNFKATITYTNVSQLRTGSAPNAWEVFWVFFNYTLDGVGKKKTNYVLVKPSGIEIGKAFDEVGQEFLFTDSSPIVAIGNTYTLTITKNGPHVTILLDGVLAADFESAAAPKQLYDTPGAIGLYSEDAQVRVSSVVIEVLP